MKSGDPRTPFPAGQRSGFEAAPIAQRDVGTDPGSAAKLGSVIRRRPPQTPRRPRLRFLRQLVAHELRRRCRPRSPRQRQRPRPGSAGSRADTRWNLDKVESRRPGPIDLSHSHPVDTTNPTVQSSHVKPLAPSSSLHCRSADLDQLLSAVVLVDDLFLSLRLSSLWFLFVVCQGRRCDMAMKALERDQTIMGLDRDQAVHEVASAGDQPFLSGDVSSSVGQ